MAAHRADRGGEERPVPGLFQDLDELNHAISGSELELIQLEPGGLAVRASSVDIDELSVDRGSINRNLRVRGGLDTERYSLGIFHPGARARLNGIAIDPSAVLFMTPGLELDGHLCEFYGWTSLVIPAAWVETISLAARDAGFLSMRTGCRGLRPDARKLHDLFLATAALVASRSPAASSEEGDTELCLNLRNALGAVLSEFDTSDGGMVSGTVSQYRVARRAERCIRDRGSENVSVDELCAELQVSRRYLEYAFRDAFGTSPSRYSRLLRLHHVRRRLRRLGAATTVTTEALDHGFTHLGWFSMQYRALFGESPRSTLNRQTIPGRS